MSSSATATKRSAPGKSRAPSKADAAKQRAKQEATFAWEGRDRAGKKITGEMRAAGEAETPRGGTT